MTLEEIMPRLPYPPRGWSAWAMQGRWLSSEHPEGGEIMISIDYEGDARVSAHGPDGAAAVLYVPEALMVAGAIAHCGAFVGGECADWVV